MADIFFYGSLRDRELLEIVLGRELPRESLCAAAAEGYATRRLADEDYPTLAAEAGARAEGVVFMGASAEDLDRLAFFEEAEYGLAPITVQTAQGRFPAQYFQATAKSLPTAEPWDFEHWRRHHRPVAIEATRELMAHYGRLAADEIDRIWPGLMIRARQRARARAEPAPRGRLRTGFDRGDVAFHATERPYTGFLSVEEHRLSHRRFDGSWSSVLDRTTVHWGDAVTVLPYDPRRDRVLLIEQFRPAPAARGDANPWCLEVVAGRIDGPENAEQTARREAREEAGVTIARMREIGRYYSTAGLAAEHMTSFVGEADLIGTGGLHGLATEHEDIRTLVLDFDAAMAAVASAEVNTAQALVSLLWLAANRGALGSAWAAEPGGSPADSPSQGG